MFGVDTKLLWRDWRGGQLNVIVSALVLAVVVVTAVSLFADRVERGLNQQISSFLASDLALRGGMPIQDADRKYAEQLNLTTADTATFRSMVFAGDNQHLASIKAVSKEYPLRGVLTTSEELNSEIYQTSEQGPKVGEIWGESRLFTLLNISLGDTIDVGYAKLTVSKVLIDEPDRGAGFDLAGARVMMNINDLPKTKLVRPGSRISFTMLMKGDGKNIQSYLQWYKAKIKSQKKSNTTKTLNHYRIVTPESAQSQLADALQRGRTFLLLSGTIGVLLSGLAMALASQRYASKLTDQVALMKAWGLSSNAIRKSQFIRLFIMTSIATAIGLFIGWLAHYALLSVAKEILDIELPSPSARPWMTAIITSFVCILGFALPALWHLPTIAPLRVLRRDLPNTMLSQGKRLWVGVSALWLLSWWYSQNIVTALLFLVAVFVLFAVCAFISLQLLKITQRFGDWQGSYVRLGLSNLWRRKGHTLIQLVGFSVTFMLLLVVMGLRANLIDEWEAQLPTNTPSHFIYNVANEEVDGVKNILTNANIEPTEWFPMVRGRLTKLNGQAVTPEQRKLSNALRREVNFTQTDLLPENNIVADGTWWNEKPSGLEFSLEEKVAKDIGLTVGDTVEFSIGGITIKAKLASIRSVDWQGMTPNFFVIFYPGTLDDYAPNWITTVRTKNVPQRKAIMNTMAKQYPTAVVLELTDIVAKIKDLIQRVTRGLEMILGVVLLCGGLVLFASIGLSYDERLRENAILRTLGSSKKIILGALTVEYAALGTIAGLVASAGAELVLYLAQTRLLAMQPQWHSSIWVIGIGAGVVVITFLGVWRSRGMISAPPLQSLREIE